MKRFWVLLFTGVLGLSPSVWAVKTQYWTHTTFNDFSAGEYENVVISNQGNVKLSRELHPLWPEPQDSTVVITSLIRMPDQSVVFATFPDSRVIRLHQGKSDTIARFEGKTITALASDTTGSLYVAVTDGQAELFRIDAGKERPESVYKPEDINYIWSIIDDGHRMVIGVGTPARVIELSPQPRVIATLDGDNVLCLLVDKKGGVYAGTDRSGLVYRILAGTRPELVFDAPEDEVSSLALDSMDRLLVATAQAGEHVRSKTDSPTGKPEQPARESNLPSETPSNPKLPDHSSDIIPETPADLPAPPVTTQPSEASTPDGSRKSTSGPIQPGRNTSSGENSGNALYRISETGLATELFRDALVIYDLVVDGDWIYLATGESGNLYAIHPTTEEQTVVVHTNAAQISRIAKTDDGTLYLATSNMGGVYSLNQDIARKGFYTSPVLDAGLMSRFGKMQLRGRLPEGTQLWISTRSGNTEDAESATWSDWSEPQEAKEFLDIRSPSARYLQYKLEFRSEGQSVPTLEEIRLAYQKPNIAPRIDSVTVENDPNQPKSKTITWSATDPNEDKLTYTVFVRAIGRGGWVELAKDLENPTYTWSARDAADGRYEIKVVASDALDNEPGQGHTASRISETVAIDNTAPVIGDVTINGTTVTFRVVDRNGLITSLDYAINSVQHWQRKLPDDNISDSPEERYRLDLGPLPPGQHTLTLRATDNEGNTAFETIAVSVSK
jgi:hypothetical protein